MSIENAKAFIEKVKTDEDFRDGVEEHEEKTKRMAYIKWAGFEFSESEVRQVKEESWIRHTELRSDWIDAMMLIDKGRRPKRSDYPTNCDDPWEPMASGV